MRQLIMTIGLVGVFAFAGPIMAAPHAGGGGGSRPGSSFRPGYGASNGRVIIAVPGSSIPFSARLSLGSSLILTSGALPVRVPMSNRISGIGGVGVVDGSANGELTEPVGPVLAPTPSLGSSTQPFPLSLDSIPSTAPGALQQMQTQTGMRIVEVFEDGAAKKADLRPDDVILGVGNTRVNSLVELQSALAQAKGETDIVFINSESGQLERLPVTPVDGKIGVAVAPINLK